MSAQVQDNDSLTVRPPGVPIESAPVGAARSPFGPSSGYASPSPGADPTAKEHCHVCLSPKCRAAHGQRPTSPSVSVVVPARNEERNIGWVLDRVPAWVAEVIVVDGRSVDATVEVVNDHPAQNLKVLHQVGAGKGSALAEGLSAASGDIIVMLDADGSMDPAEIPMYVGALLAGADVVKGSRAVAGGGSADLSPLRRAGNWGLGRAANLLYGHTWSELCYGYAAFWADVLDDMGVRSLARPAPHHWRGPVGWGGPQYGHGFEIEALLFCRAERAGLRVAEVFSYEYERRSGNSNLMTWRDGSRVLMALLRERSWRKPDPRPHWHGTTAVVVTAFTMDRWDEIVAAIAGASSGSRAPDELVLVVDHNDDLLARATSELAPKYPQLQIVSSSHARGCTGARNQGAAVTVSDVIVYLDDDAEPGEDWLEELVAPFADQEVQMTGGHLSPGWPRGHRPLWFPPEFDWVVGATYRGMPTTQQEVRNPIGASMAVRRSAYESAGGFHEKMGRVGNGYGGAEETSLAIRIRQSSPSAKVIYVPTSVATHKVSTRRTKFSYFIKRCWAEGRSKVLLGQQVGADDALASERQYVLLVLPRALLTAIAGGLVGRRGALRRAGALLAGLGATAAGYASGKLCLLRAKCLPPQSQTGPVVAADAEDDAGPVPAQDGRQK